MHQHFENREPDDHYFAGELKYLVVGNRGRVLDGRRTPGYIEQYHAERAMFTWRITAFEDCGKCWEIPAEEIVCYQFQKDSSCLSQEETEAISERCRYFSQQITILPDAASLAETKQRIQHYEEIAERWLRANSRFLKERGRLDFTSVTGDGRLYQDLSTYLEAVGVLELERITAEQYLLNPYSGEWMKAMKMIMAEMGLIDYSGKILRDASVFSGIGTKENRMTYIAARVAFLRTLFQLLGIAEVPLYRGVSSETDFYKTPNSLLSCTFSSDMAKEFAGVDHSDPFRSCYWMKFMCPVEKLFMTFLETQELNGRYREQEAIIFYKNIAWM